MVSDAELLSELLRGMDIPALGREPTASNPAVNNADRPNLDQALTLVRKLSRKKSGEILDK